MFFVLSKTVGRLLTPQNLSLVLAAGWLSLRLIGRAARLRRGLGIAALSVALLSSLPAVSELLLYPLETACPRPTSLPAEPAAIVMLCGVMRPAHRSPYELSSAADRFVEAVVLARRYPRAKLLISGGASQLWARARAEAPLIAALSNDLGVPPQQLLVESESRNTYENAVNSARMLREHRLTGPIVLVTSAMHMPRAMACFRNVLGAEPIPWPVDFVGGSDPNPVWLLPRLGAFVATERATREYLGLLAYYVAGYI